LKILSPTEVSTWAHTVEMEFPESRCRNREGVPLSGKESTASTSFLKGDVIQKMVKNI
jgi:hypothetical protein